MATIHYSCNVKRRMVVKHGKIGFDARPIEWTHSTVEEKDCGTPLWTKEERATGICSSCRAGWEVEGNYSIDPRVPSTLHPVVDSEHPR